MPPAPPPSPAAPRVRHAAHAQQGIGNGAGSGVARVQALGGVLEHTIWMRRRMGWCAKLLAGDADRSSPSKVMRPDVGSMRRMTMVEVVDLPQQLSSPRGRRSRPLFTSKEIPSTARKRCHPPSPAFLPNREASSAVGAPCRGYSFTRFSTVISGARPPARLPVPASSRSGVAIGQQIGQHDAGPGRRAHQLARIWMLRIAEDLLAGAVSTTTPFSITITVSQ